MAKTMLRPRQNITTAEDILRTQRVWAGLLLRLQETPHPLAGMAHAPATAEDLVAHLVADRLCDPGLPFAPLRATLLQLLAEEPSIMISAALDLHAYCTRGADDTDDTTVFLHDRGFLATQAYRLAHALWGNG